MFFEQEVMLFDVEAKTPKEIITTIAAQLATKGITKEGFLPHVIAREEEYPTGLSTEGLGVAIPHTDSKFVNQSQIAFASLKRPVLFRDMVDKNKTVSVSLIFMIAMASPHEQAGVLSNLMTMFQDTEALKKLNTSESKQDVMRILNQHGIS
ncbi:PTS sugar transporter subunit IIA [Lacticaseibacillus salsurivasis]|uniref:PTS sugar transporter subunit IIA n=1 Tax=Lacticaseibacillus salsurivasis TaxID=3081441 RepID=UPI0030C6C2B1